MSGIGCITVFSLHWLDHGIVEFDDQIIVNFVLLGRFRLSDRWIPAIVASCLSSPMVSGNPLVVSIILHVDIFTSVLNRLVVKRVVSGFADIVWRHEVIDFAVFDLLGVDGRRHVEVVLLRLSSGVVGRLVPVVVDHSLVGCVDGHLLFWVVSSISHSHLFLEVDLGELVAFLPILDFLIPLVNKMITSGNVIVSVIFDTFLRILSIKVILIE